MAGKIEKQECKKEQEEDAQEIRVSFSCFLCDGQMPGQAVAQNDSRKKGQDICPEEMSAQDACIGIIDADDKQDS